MPSNCNNIFSIRRIGQMWRYWRSAILFAAILDCGNVNADTITISGTVVRTPRGGLLVLVKIDMKDAEGNPITIDTVVVDSGDSDGITFGKNDAAKAGLVEGAPVRTTANGGVGFEL